jgi:hypothetical protein
MDANGDLVGHGAARQETLLLALKARRPARAGGYDGRVLIFCSSPTSASAIAFRGSGRGLLRYRCEIDETVLQRVVISCHQAQSTLREASGYSHEILFFLMPWPHMPDDFRQKHRSVWVDLPSRMYQPGWATASPGNIYRSNSPIGR